MKGRVQWKNAAMIVFVGLLIVVPIASISYSFGAGSMQTATTQATINFIKQDLAQQQQALKEAQAEETRLNSMNLTDNEKQMHTLIQKIRAAAAAGAVANKNLVDAVNQMAGQHH